MKQVHKVKYTSYSHDSNWNSFQHQLSALLYYKHLSEQQPVYHISLLKFWPQDIVFLKENLAESQLQLREFSKVYSRLMGQIIITLEMEHQELKKERHHQLKQLSKTDTVTIVEKLKKENNKLNRAVPCVPDTISKVKIELDLNATINTK